MIFIFIADFLQIKFDAISVTLLTQKSATNDKIGSNGYCGYHHKIVMLFKSGYKSRKFTAPNKIGNQIPDWGIGSR